MIESHNLSQAAADDSKPQVAAQSNQDNPQLLGRSTVPGGRDPNPWQSYA